MHLHANESICVATAIFVKCLQTSTLQIVRITKFRLIMLRPLALLFKCFHLNYSFTLFFYLENSCVAVVL